jgi:hypothetical protein
VHLSSGSDQHSTTRPLQHSTTPRLQHSTPVPLPRGVFTISIDTELAWGGFDRADRESRWALEERSREVIRRLLALFERYAIPATWAVVGHLFLKECCRVDGRAHPDLPRPEHDWFPGDWYRLDPGTDAGQAPLWYGPDIIEALLAARPAQEVASHSFSHAIFGDAGCSAAAAEAEVRACVAAAAPWGVELRSFVYPRNRVGHLDALPRHGFRCYRGPDPAWFATLPRKPRRLAHFLDDLLALPPPTVLPRREGALWNIPGSMMLQGMDGPRRLIPAGCRTRRALAGLQRAARRREIFHLWFHPVNFSAELDRMLSLFEPVLAQAARLRDRGELEVLTMGEMVERLESRSKSEGEM